MAGRQFVNKQDTTLELKEFLIDNKLNESYGIIHSIKPEYQELTFCRSNIDGFVRIYNDRITVDYQILGKEFTISSTASGIDMAKEYLENIRG